jgi:acyl carrier protein
MKQDASASSLERAKDILSGCLFVPKERIADDATISAIGEIDSLAFELLVLEIERAIGSEVDPIKMLELRSVADLAAMLTDAGR